MTECKLHGLEFGNCNCAYGCGCQVNALPTHGSCQAIGFFKTKKGYCLNMASDARRPGAVDGGHGVMQPAIDERADEKQRQALIMVLHGGEIKEAKTHWWVFRAMSSTARKRCSSRSRWI